MSRVTILGFLDLTSEDESSSELAGSSVRPELQFGCVLLSSPSSELRSGRSSLALDCVLTLKRGLLCGRLFKNGPGCTQLEFRKKSSFK